MAGRSTVLVVEDDPKVRALLRNLLEDEGFDVLEADTGARTLELVASNHLDLLTLDIHLGAENGLEIARDVRKASDVPMIMVTGKDDVIDRVVGLEVGADDYITKPFHVREVVARIRALLRRRAMSGVPEPVGPDADTPETVEAVLYFDGVRAVLDSHEVLDRSGKDCGLTSGDFALLRVFLERPKRVLSRDQLMDLTGGVEWSPLDRTIDNQVARLRKKIERNPSEPKLIKTVRGVGYMFSCDVDREPPQGDLSKMA